MKKSLVITTISTAVIGLGVGAYFMLSGVNKDEPAPITPSISAVSTVTPVEPVVEPIVAEPVAETPVVTEVAPEILSTQEYGEQYLDISTEIQQKCFDMIIATFPDKFTPELREQSVKELARYMTVCHSGIMHSDRTKQVGIIYYSLYFNS